jgi:hypothetical protein
MCCWPTERREGHRNPLLHDLGRHAADWQVEGGVQSSKQGGCGEQGSGASDSILFASFSC